MGVTLLHCTGFAALPLSWLERFPVEPRWHNPMINTFPRYSVKVPDLKKYVFYCYSCKHHHTNIYFTISDIFQNAVQDSFQIKPEKQKTDLTVYISLIPVNVYLLVLIRSNIDISNSDMSNLCKILLKSNSLAQSKILSQSNHGYLDSLTRIANFKKSLQHRTIEN